MPFDKGKNEGDIFYLYIFHLMSYLTYLNRLNLVLMDSTHTILMKKMIRQIQILILYLQ